MLSGVFAIPFYVICRSSSFLVVKNDLFPDFHNELEISEIFSGKVIPIRKLIFLN